MNNKKKEIYYIPFGSPAKVFLWSAVLTAFLKDKQTTEKIITIGRHLLEQCDG